MPLTETGYNRAAAISYADKWALGRNPAYYDFEYIGGDCTNYISQCIFAGAGVMNYTPITGWYYNSLLSRAPAWSGVEYLYNFLTGNKGPGPYGRKVPMEQAVPGDICQLLFTGTVYGHTPFIVWTGEPKIPENILIDAHTNDSKNRPLSTYSYKEIRFIHIDGVRKYV